MQTETAVADVGDETNSDCYKMGLFEGWDG